jgi:uncharacterized repeat protein (TIGR01451 family)
MKNTALRVVALALLASVPAAEAGFAPPVSYPADTEPISVVVADFNGDGKPDLAVACIAHGVVEVLLGNGNGTFQSALATPAGGSPRLMAVGDFNGDGKPDLAVPGYSAETVSILLGLGGGLFQAAAGYAAGSEPFFAAVADFNGDGKSDLAIANLGSANVSILLGNGNGTFQPAVDYATGASPHSVVVGDFNGDGKPDLAVVSSGSNSVSILLGNGNGTLQSPVAYGVGANPLAAAVGDFNGDGKPDLAVANYGSSSVSILLGNGYGAFQAAVGYGAGPTPQAVVVADFNLDGKPDLAAGSSLLLGNGDGTFQAPGGGAGGVSMAAGDFNQDGPPDLAAVSISGNSVFVYLNEAGKLTSTTTLGSSVNPSSLGQSVTFTATVTPGSGGSGVPTGMVTFRDGATMLGTATLAAGSATLTTSALTGGNHAITVVYAGDATFIGSTSAVLTQAVNPADLSITKTDGQTTTAVGLPITYTIVASNAGPNPAVGATVTDNVPSRMTGVTWTCAGAGGGTCTASGTGSINDTVDLPANATVTYTLSGTVGISASSPLANTASVTAGGVADPNDANNAVTDADTVPFDCDSATVVVPDGRLTQGSIPAAGTLRFGSSLRIGNSYSAEFRSDTGDAPPGVLAAFTADDRCNGNSTLVPGDTSGIEPAGGGGIARVGFTAAGPESFFRAILVNGSGSAISFSFSLSDTTMYSAAWSTNGSFDTYYALQNTTATDLHGTLTLLDAAGSVLSTFSLSIPAGQTASTNTSSQFVARGKTGTARFTHDGPPGAILAEAAIANFTISPAYVQPVKLQAVREAR